MWKNISASFAIIAAIGTLISILGTACRTTEKSDQAHTALSSSSQSKAEFYQLSKGATVANPELLPNYIPFYLKEVGESGVIRAYLKYRGWDFDKDGVIDMLEELSPEGDTLSRTFDFKEAQQESVFAKKP